MPSIDTECDRYRAALERILQWAEAYPLYTFPEADAEYLNRAHEVLSANKLSLARISASAMRHCVVGIGHIAREALDGTEDEAGER